MKTLKEIGEFGFIDRIRRGCLIRPDRVVKAIGDDAAAFESPPDLISLVTTDMLVERIHFIRAAIDGFDLGYKSLAVNLSDIAAMGGVAQEAFVSIAIPQDCDLAYLEAIYRGMKKLAAGWGVNILGGDTTSSKVDLVISVTVYGAVPPDQILYRNGAKPGDIVFCTGYLGDSAAGLHLILKELPADTPTRRRLLEAHLHPDPHLSEGRFLACAKGVHSAIDVSDGLSADLGHILDESKAGANLNAADIPISADLASFCDTIKADPLEFALAGGEDYVLLGTCAANHIEALAADYREEFGTPLHRIGEITAISERLLTDPDGNSIPIGKNGWDHFKKESK